MKVIKKVSRLETAKAAQDEAAAKRNIPKGGLVIPRDSRVGRGPTAKQQLPPSPPPSAAESEEKSGDKLIAESNARARAARLEIGRITREVTEDLAIVATDLAKSAAQEAVKAGPSELPEWLKVLDRSARAVWDAILLIRALLARSAPANELRAAQASYEKAIELHQSFAKSLMSPSNKKEVV